MALRSSPGPPRSVLSYFEDYFTPDGDAPLSGHSTGQIAAHLYASMDERWGCRHVPQEPIDGLEADVFVGHFWSFLDYCRRNDFRRRVAVYPIADPLWTREVLQTRADEFGVPMPWWDLPPCGFDHRATMAAADAVLVVGNGFTLRTYASEDRGKIHLVNYGPDVRLPASTCRLPDARRVCYVATHCDLRKGFMDVLETWAGIDEADAELHVIGAIRPPWDDLLAACRSNSITYHGFINSKDAAYADLIASCRFAFLPTYSEGQVGTLLEAVRLGCVPITTIESGLSEEVLERSIMVVARDIEGQRRAIRDAVSWSDDTFVAARDAVQEAAGRLHTWPGFDRAVGRLFDSIVG